MDLDGFVYFAKSISRPILANTDILKELGRKIESEEAWAVQ